MRTTSLAVAVAALAVMSGAARADDALPAPRAERGLGAVLEVGGFGALTGPASYGPAAALELSWKRLGGALRWRGFEGLDRGQVTAGITYEAAAARPLLVLALHADAGVTYGGDVLPVLGGGVHTRLFVLPPLYVGTDATAYLVLDGVADTALAFGVTGVVGVGF